VVPLYAIALVAGILAAAPFVLGTGPRPPRPVTAALLGVGLGGLSSSFAGWPTALSLVAAVVGGGALGAFSVVLDPDRRSGPL
jgi:hypothetical protein